MFKIMAINHKSVFDPQLLFKASECHCYGSLIIMEDLQLQNTALRGILIQEF